MYQIKRSGDEIDRVMNWAHEGQNSGTRYAGMSYEEGITAMLDWLTGISDEAPDDE